MSLMAFRGSWRAPYQARFIPDDLSYLVAELFVGCDISKDLYIQWVGG